MERKIAFADLERAVSQAYEDNKGLNEGAIDPRNLGADPKAFGITVALPDGTLINKADTQVKAPLGSIAKIPLSTILFEQNGAEGLVKKSGQCPCHKLPEKPKDIPFSAHGVRAFSAVEPVGDPESKWNLFEGRAIDLMGSAPELDDRIFEALQKEAADADFEKKLADQGYYLYDNAALAIKLYLKALAMKASTEQLALMGATIAADGVNPTTGNIVYDGALTRYIVAMMAAKGPHKMNLPWLVKSGMPAKSSYGGTIVAVIPGVISIAAYAPALNSAGVSIKAAKALFSISKALDLSIFSSAKVQFVK